MATSRDIQEIVSKLSSEKTKLREEGIKLLNSWMEGERSIGFCKLLGQNTARLKPNEIPHAETWPFLVSLLMKCIALEITASKRRLPKLSFAKTLRSVIQRAEDSKFSGKVLLLLSVVKSLFNHIWDVVKDVPSFQFEYGIILRHLLAVKEYRFHMRKRVYCYLVLWYTNKVEVAISEKDSIQSKTKEEVFRYILSLHSLLENPPGDFPQNLREDLIKGFVGIFRHVREEGKISRKLVECINVFLLRDGPNLGYLSTEIHSALQEFMLRFWLSTHDRCLKNALVLYARIQLKLCRSPADGNPLIEHLLDVVGKELDQGNVAGTGVPWVDACRDDKLGTLANEQHDLMDLAASVFYQASTNMTKTSSSSEKRFKREDAAARMKDGIVKGKWLWIGAFCFLIRNYRSRISKALVNYWFEGVCESFERILNDGNRVHAYDALLWMLRSLQELSSVMPFLTLKEDSMQFSSTTSSEVNGGWHLIWSCLIHALPMFRNLTSIADAALVLLGNIISNDSFNFPDVPQDVWDLWIFKHKPSVCALYFIACYFSRKGCQGNLQEVLHLRQTLLRVVLGLVNIKPFVLNERMVMLLPVAIFSLCSGCVAFQPLLRELSMTNYYIDILESTDARTKIEDHDLGLAHELFECSIEHIAEIEPGSRVEVYQTECQHGLRLPRQIRHPLVREMEDYFLVISNQDIEKMLLSDLFLLCTFLCNCIYSLMLTRLKDEKSAVHTNMLQCLLKLLEHAVTVIQENQNELQSHGSLASSLVPDATTSTFASLRFCMCSPLFKFWREEISINNLLHQRIILVIERLLLALGELFEVLSRNTESVLLVQEISESSTTLTENTGTQNGGKVRIVDMELDLDDDSKDMDISAVSGRSISGTSFSTLQLKLDMISAISTFFSILPDITWDVLFSIVGKENDPKVCENILCCLCENFSCSTRNISDLVNSLNNAMDSSESPKHFCVNTLTAVKSLLHTLLSSASVEKEESSNQLVREKMSEQNLEPLGELVNKVAENDLLDWSARVRLIDCICYFVLLDPRIAQAMIERLLAMLQDADYRVRLFLARHISVLFRTWDGHVELFKDICSNFGVKLVMASKGKLVTAKEVLAAGVQSGLVMETAVVTLAHLAFVSEKVELEATFMISVVAAINPCQRELVFAIVDNLSRKLQYTTRSKYLEELMGSILFSWVACGVSLVSLVEIRDLFISKSEPNSFIQYCCPWVLPALILSGNINDLNWASAVASQPLKDLVKVHFVHIFSVCMALHCSKKLNKENGAVVLRSSILYMAEISEQERDDLIKKNMLSIVSFLLSLSSSASDPAMPSFPTETIVLAIKTVIDGFLEMDDYPMNVGVVDKINIFRPDRVFKFLVEIHYQITSAVHPWHRCNRLSAIEVLINIIGYRVAVPSTSCYLFSLVGQYIGCDVLQDKCCLILSTLLEAFQNNPTKDVIHVLGEQLQFLVYKLVACCIPSKNDQEHRVIQSSRIISLLNQLTVDADPSFHKYIKELEPFPELDCFERIRSFHLELCKAYSPKDHLLKFVKRACYLPQRLLLWSLQSLHKKLLLREIIQPEKNEYNFGEFDRWHCEPDIVSAVWTLVGICGSNDAKDIRELVADFISRVGIGDPHHVVFHLPGDSNEKSSFQLLSNEDVRFYYDIAVSEELLVKLIRILKKYLLADSVKIVDVTSRALKGILSTEWGRRALLAFDSYDMSIIEIHSKGVNINLVEKLLLDFERKSSAEAINLNDPSVWKTEGKTYDTWICHLVYSLISHTNETILRLCQDIVFLKAEVAELLFPNVLVNLAGRTDLDLELFQIISAQIQENIFAESNDMIKSVQVTLDALNKLRLCHVSQISGSSLAPSKREIPKHAKSSSSSSRARHSYTSEKSKNPSTAPKTAVTNSTWKKVYWLSIDYLVVAKAAIRCGSYFTSVMYVEQWCEEHFNSLTLGKPDFSHSEKLPPHIELLVAAITQINEPDSIYGIIQSHKLTSQIITYEHEGNWSKALEYYDLLVRTAPAEQTDLLSGYFSTNSSQHAHHPSYSKLENDMLSWKSYKGLMRSLQQTGCTHVLDLYCQGLITQKGLLQNDSEFTEMQYEAAWRAGNWDLSLLSMDVNSLHSRQFKNSQFNENLYCCLRALQEGDLNEFHVKLKDSKEELVLKISNASKESTENIYSAIVKLQILDHLSMVWGLRWKPSPCETMKAYPELQNISPEPVIPAMAQLEWLNLDWSIILKRTQLNLNLLEPFIAFRRVLLQILNCKDCTMQHLLQSAATLRKGFRFSLAAAALHELKLLSAGAESQQVTSHICSLGRLEEAKLLRAQGQNEMAINLAKYILDHYQLDEEASNVHRLVGKWLAETRSSNSRTILEQYLKRAVDITEVNGSTGKKCINRQCQTYYHLAHYTDALFRSYEERLASSEWQAAMRLRKHKTKELEALVKRLKSSTKGEKTDYAVKIQELQKQLAMDKEEAEKLKIDRDSFLKLALEGYQRCLVLGDKYDLRVVFRLVSLWFSLSSRQNVTTCMLSAVKEVQSYKFVPLIYQIASRMGSSIEGQGSENFQYALLSLVKKMAIDHPYHTLFQLLALANGDRVKDKLRSRNSFVVDRDKKLAAENLLNELLSFHGAIIRQMKQLVEIYIKLAELETGKEDKRITLPREIRSVRELEHVPVVTATFPIDKSCQYPEGSFPHFKGLADSIEVMIGINAPKVVECMGSNGHRYRQLAKSGNDDLRQDAVMEQFFGLVNTFLRNHRDTWKRRLRIRTYKVVPFTPSAGVLEWVDRTIPLGDYLTGSSRNGGAHRRYRIGDWTYSHCRQYMTKEIEKRKAFLEVCENFRPVMHCFFLERYLQPAEWFEKRLSYTRSVAASSMVGYIVGLGDRHSMNILIDEATAEVVHIDLGVAFEQGLMLKTPERVPFRLTRDIVDGMGVTGVEGVFRRCCEETLSVMRTNKEALLTIIEVFIHDPLYKWALSPLKALQRQKETDDDIESSLDGSQDVYEGNKDAARALMRVKQKLDGYEDGEMRSVQGQVQQLIQDAIDADRLCQMFPGWGAWL